MASQTAAIKNLNAGVVFVLLVLPLRPFARADYPSPHFRCGLGDLRGAGAYAPHAHHTAGTSVATLLISPYVRRRLRVGTARKPR